MLVLIYTWRMNVDFDGSYTMRMAITELFISSFLGPAYLIFPVFVYITWRFGSKRKMELYVERLRVRTKLPKPKRQTKYVSVNP